VTVSYECLIRVGVARFMPCDRTPQCYLVEFYRGICPYCLHSATEMSQIPAQVVYSSAKSVHCLLHVCYKAKNGIQCN